MPQTTASTTTSSSTSERDGIPFHWPSFWNEDTKKKESIPDSEWDYCSASKVLYHKHRKLVRCYDFDKGHAVVCSPETAVKRGWAESMPVAYLEKYISVRNKTEQTEESRRTCQRCLAPAKKPDICRTCTDHSEWKGLVG